MKRLLTGITLLALLCTMAGCTKSRPQAPPRETVPSGATMEVTMSHSFRWEDFLPQEELGMCHFHPFGENTFVYSPKPDGTHIFGIWSQESGEFVRRDYKEQGDFTQLSGIYDMGDTVQVLLRQVINQPLSMTYLRYTFDAQMNESNDNEKMGRVELYQDAQNMLFKAQDFLAANKKMLDGNRKAEIKNAVAVLQKSMKKVKPENMTLDEEHAIRTAKDNLEMLF